MGRYPFQKQVSAIHMEAVQNANYAQKRILLNVWLGGW